MIKSLVDFGGGKFVMIRTHHKKIPVTDKNTRKYGSVINGSVNIYNTGPRCGGRHENY